MEECVEAHMDTGVSSTTDDVQEVQEVASTHNNVETVITVESIKEEDMCPRKSKQTAETKTSDTTDSAKPIPNTHSEIPLKKIIIKSPLKDLQVRPIQKSPPKTTEDVKKLASKEPLTNKSVQPSTSTLQKPLPPDSSSKQEVGKSPNKDTEKSVQSSTVNSSEAIKPVQKSPAKESQPSKEKPVPNKEAPIIIICKDKITKPQIKEQSVSSAKDSSTKMILIRESKTTPTKDFPDKQTPIKDLQSKESPIKPAQDKDAPSLPPPKTPTKETPATKESLLRVPPVKETAPKQNEPPKPPTAFKQSPAIQTASKESPAKENPIKIPPKEQPEKAIVCIKSSLSDNPIKETQALAVVTTTEKSQETSFKNKNISISDDKEASNDSQIETNSDTSEKEHNKSISRELRSLINSAKESKIISECTQLTSKTRKSRTPLDTSLNASVEADKIQGVRRGSDNSQISNSSEKSDKTAVKRSMRSQNPEFVSKVKSFLNSVSGKNQKAEEADTDDENEVKSKESAKEKESTPSLPKKKKTEEVGPEKPSIPKMIAGKDSKIRVDPYCWRCHWEVSSAANEKPQPSVNCTVCPRSFHMKCLSSQERTKVQPDKAWVCPECFQILQAEGSETRSHGMKKISLGMLCDLLKYALERMMELNGVEPFLNPVDRTEFPDYDNYVVHPMDLSLMKKNISEGLYGSTEAFLADAQWILHNSIIFNTFQAKLTGGARALVRSCRAEMGEIEACPECYAAAHARRPTWFTDVCTTPHILLWAKLKGFPYWPAKGMSVSSAGLVDVRFFGAHDRAWVPARDCFLFSEKDPNNFRTKRQDILDSMQEAEQHIRNISRKYGKFVYPPFRTTFDPTKLNEQLKLMIPSFEGDTRAPVKDKPSNSSPGSMKKKRRSNSKSSKGSFNDGDTSEGEENTEKNTSIPSRKMASGAEIARDENDFSVDKKDKEKDKNKSMEVDPPQSKENSTTSRKRRRSEMEEAVITILDNNGPREKRRRAASEGLKGEKKDKELTEKKESAEKRETPDKRQEKPKESVPSTSTGEKKNSPKVTPIRVISISKVLKSDKVSPKIVTLKDEAKTPKPKPKADKGNKEKDAEKDKSTPQEEKRPKRRNSTKNKSLNNSNAGNVEPEKSNDATKSLDATNKDKVNDNDKDKTKEKANDKDKTKGSVADKSSTDNQRPVKDRIQFDDDTSLAVIAKVAKNNTSNLPTITSVRSLSTQAHSSTNSGKSIEVIVEAAQDSSIFTPTTTDNVRNMKEAVNKLQKLRGDEPPQVGRVGVRAFARMKSPQKETGPKEVQVEIKTEPVEFDESDRMQEKMDLMSAFKLRPVVPPAKLRDVRINKVVVTPLSRAGKVSTPPQQSGMRAKKTFPQPKKPEEGRSELTSKNSMVYIPIQPPQTQAPVRAPRPVSGPATSSGTPPQNRIVTTITSSNANNIVNTVTPPLLSFSSPTGTLTSTSSSNPIQTVATMGSVPPGALTAVGGVPTVGQVPTTVHTMPLITSVNGQWTFSLQPVLSVGGVDTPSPPMLNGIAERGTLLPIAPAPPGAVLVPAAAPPSANRGGDTNSTPGELPRLQQRPPLVNPLDSNAPVGNVPPPSSAGPLTAKLNQNAVKMTDFFRTLLEESIEKLDEPTGQVTALKIQLEQIHWRHQQEMQEIKHNHDLTLAEMRASFDKEKVRLVAETRRQNQIELDAAVKLAKTKQWCANCNQEAQFYCCWNTAYCDYPCQRAHWATHYATCAQQRTQDGNSNSDNSSNPPESRLQQAPENLPKTTAAPPLAAANKLQPSRMYTQEHPPQKASIIMSMVEDNSGNQTMKCVGTYKPSAGNAQMSPLIINKQIMSSEETAKKVVTSGGYLIVGASNATNSTTITAARRATAIQYIS